MIRLEHLNLVVKDIPAALKFYQAAFPHWQVRGEGSQEWYGKPRNWLHFGDDYQYLTLNDSGEGENRDLQGHSVGLAHFAFVVTDLDGLLERMANAGFHANSRGTDEPYRDTAYFFDPDGFEVEFVTYSSDLPAKRNHYSEP